VNGYLALVVTHYRKVEPVPALPWLTNSAGKMRIHLEIADPCYLGLIFPNRKYRAADAYLPYCFLDEETSPGVTDCDCTDASIDLDVR